MTLAELGQILATPGGSRRPQSQRALNFDGGSSSAFWFAGERGPVSLSEHKTVRNFVGGRAEVKNIRRFRRDADFSEMSSAFFNLRKSA